MKNKGFTLIELMIVMAIIGILIAVAFGAKTRKSQEHIQPLYTEPVVENVVPATQCIEGYKFYNNLQIKDRAGNGIEC